MKGFPEDLEERDAEQLRLLVIKGIADGNDPAARSLFLHATDSLQRSQKIYMERRQLCRPVIVRWPFAAVPEEYRWDIGGGNMKARGKCRSRMVTLATSMPSCSGSPRTWIRTGRAF